MDPTMLIVGVVVLALIGLAIGRGRRRGHMSTPETGGHDMRDWK